MMESDNIKTSVGKKVKIFFNNFKYEGILLFEDEQVYRINDQREGIINIPRNNSVLKEVVE
jgi:hypothetical protein